MESPPVSNERLGFGMMGYGCQHYRRRCKILAPCCNEIFTCRHCHNEAKNMLKKPFNRHELNRYDVKQLICAVCDTEQPVAQVCTNCGVNMGEYFCEICKFFDDDTAKGQFHCNDCGICRVGGRDNYFHCKKCGSCYAKPLRDNHLCVESSMRHHCPICYEYLFDSLKETTVMKCGHTMHGECCNEMIKRDKYCCPICSKSIIDMSRTWKRTDEEIEATVIPEDYRNRKVWILCNDTTEVFSMKSGRNAGTANHTTPAQVHLQFFLNDQALASGINPATFIRGFVACIPSVNLAGYFEYMLLFTNPALLQHDSEVAFTRVPR